jgi:NAD(P)-dependent dehydrogenase (short-subunit alcohol dehydrogenase family)
VASPALEPFAAFRLDDRIALVTGASSGLGARFARVLAAAGARVVLVARRRDRIDALAAELPGARAIAADLSDGAERERLVREVLAACGRVDVLVNNAGASDGPQPAESERMDLWRRVVAVNQDAVFHLSTLLAPGMIERGGGCIVNVTSVHAFVGSAPNKQAAYVATKGAVTALTRELALQWARHGIRVNALAPGYFGTELTGEMIADPKGLGWITRNTPLGRPGRADELDGALLYLASDAASFVTGTTLIVDGGWTAR